MSEIWVPSEIKIKYGHVISDTSTLYDRLAPRTGIPSIINLGKYRVTSATDGNIDDDVAVNVTQCITNT